MRVLHGSPLAYPAVSSIQLPSLNPAHHPFRGCPPPCDCVRCPASLSACPVFARYSGGVFNTDCPEEQQGYLRQVALVG